MSNLSPIGAFSSLPIDIFINILSRLPTKTLFACLFLSKSFRTLLHDPRFTLIHHSYQISNPSPSIILRDIADDNHYLLDYQSLNNLTFQQRKTPTLLSSYQREKIVGSCHGLLLLKLHKSGHVQTLYSICNPITGDRMALPISPKFMFDACSSGFGLNPKTHEFKVVSIVENKEARLEAEVFVLDSGCYWRSLPNVATFFSTKPTQDPVFVSGALHWLESNASVIRLTCFDLGNEEFGEIGMPSGVYSDLYESYYIGGFEDRLCFVDNHSVEATKVWVMGEYGVQDSWNVQYVIRCGGRFHPMTRRIYVLMHMENGEIVMTNEHHVLGYYDPKKDSFRPISVQGIYPNIGVLRTGSLIPPVVHVESLISPRDIGRLKKRQ